AIAAAATAAASASTRCAVAGRLLPRLRRRRRDVSASNDHAAHVIANVEHSLRAIVAPDLPAHQVRKERGLLLVVRRLEREVVHVDRIPPRWLEGRRKGRRVALRSAGAGAAAASLTQRPCERRTDRRDAERLQKLAPSDHSAVEVVE